MISDGRDGARRPVVAVIPARGGSKGVPRKNVAPVAGIPLIARSIRAALATRSVDEVIVSTDDPEIAALSRQHGADVVARPAEISGDAASSESALLHVIESRAAHAWVETGILVFLQCTSPFTTADDIDGTVEAMVFGHGDSSLAVCEFHHFVWKQDPASGLVGINHDKSFRARRQDRETQYLETGSVYAMDVRGFCRARHRFFGTTRMYVVPAWRAVEIDDAADLALAEAMVSARALS